MLQEVPYNNGFGAAKDRRKEKYTEAVVMVESSYWEAYIEFQSEYCIGVACGEDGFTQTDGTQNCPWIRGRWEGDVFIVEDFGVKGAGSFRQSFF